MARSTSKSKSEAKESQLEVLAKALSINTNLNSQDILDVMKVVKDWVYEGDFGRAVQLLAKVLNEAVDDDEDFISEILVPSLKEVTEADVTEAIAVVDATIGELELKSVLDELSKLYQDKAAIDALKVAYPEIKMPMSLTTRLEQLEHRRKRLKKLRPDLNHPAECE